MSGIIEREGERGERGRQRERERERERGGGGGMRSETYKQIDTYEYIHTYRKTQGASCAFSSRAMDNKRDKYTPLWLVRA